MRLARARTAAVEFTAVLEDTRTWRAGLEAASAGRFMSQKKTDLWVDAARIDSLAAGGLVAEARRRSAGDRVRELLEPLGPAIEEDGVLARAVEAALADARERDALADALVWAEIGRRAGLGIPPPALQVEVDAPGATARLWPLDAEEGGPAASNTVGDDLGPGPWHVEGLEPGLYRLAVSAPGRATVVHPFLALPGGVEGLHLDLPAASDVGEGMIVVAPGEVVVGGDPDAANPSPPYRVPVAAYALGRTTVTVSQYLAFLRDLDESSPMSAETRLPRRERGGRPMWIRGHGDRVQRVDGSGGIWPADLPMVYVDWDDAVAYANWLGEREGRAYRLPSRHEWVRGARGAGRRAFPWGDGIDEDDATVWFAGADGRRPDAYEAFVLKSWHWGSGAGGRDISPAGVLGAAGGVREWCWERNARLVQGEPKVALPRFACVVGGAYTLPPHLARVSSWSWVDCQQPGQDIGFRLAQDFEGGPKLARLVSP